MLILKAMFLYEQKWSIHLHNFWPSTNFTSQKTHLSVTQVFIISKHWFFIQKYSVIDSSNSNQLQFGTFYTLYAVQMQKQNLLLQALLYATAS